MSRNARLFLASLIAVGVAASGCGSSKDKRVGAIRSDLTPEMKTLHNRPDDVRNSLAIYYNEMERMMWQDLGRAFYTDRPSRLTPEPVPR